MKKNNFAIASIIFSFILVWLISLSPSLGQWGMLATVPFFIIAGFLATLFAIISIFKKDNGKVLGITSLVIILLLLFSVAVHNFR